MFYSVQFLRFWAAIAVAGYHSVTLLASRGAEVSKWLMHVAWIGSAGVPIFFVISGFVMVFTSRGNFGQSGASLKFLMRRVVRIYPIYLVCAALYLALPPEMRAEAIPMADLVKSLLLLPGHASRIIDPGWTLAYELYFYAIFACVLLFRRRAALWVLGLFIAGSLAVGQIAKPQGAFAIMATNVQLLLFLAGAFIGYVAVIRSNAKRAHLSPMIPVAVGLALIGLAVAPWLRDAGVPNIVTIGIPAILLVSALIVAELAGSLPPFFAGLAWLGDSSYSLYLIHSLVIAHAVRLFDPVPAGPAGTVVIALLLTAMSFLAGLALHRWIERPLLASLRWRMRGDRDVGTSAGMG
jgi:peptidoglycan/LPS O-acetylase OafA/YrhL